MRKLITGILFSLALPVAFAHSQEFVGEASKALTPYEAIQLAAADPANGVTGVFEFEVRGSGKDKRFVYLNSEKDYRDQRNLTIRMPTSILPKLEQRLGVKFQDLKNRRLVILGVAKRNRINFVNDGQPTGKYYYQTHVHVDSPTQIKFAE